MFKTKTFYFAFLFINKKQLIFINMSLGYNYLFLEKIVIVFGGGLRSSSIPLSQLKIKNLCIIYSISKKKKN